MNEQTQIALPPYVTWKKRRDGKHSFAIERPEFYVQTGSMFENPHGVPHEEIVRMIMDNPPEVTAQTVFGKYVESSGLVFTGELIQMLFDRRYERVLGSRWMDRQAAQDAQAIFRRRRGRRNNNRYYTGVDLARQTDYTVIFTIDVRHRPARVVYYRRVNRVPWASIYSEIGLAVYLFGNNVLFDSTGPGGDVVGDALESHLYCHQHNRAVESGQRCMRNGQPLECKPAEYLALSCCDGFHFTGTTKKELVEHLRNVLGNGYTPDSPDPFGLLRCPPIPVLEEELAFYAWDDKKLMTDALFGLALACWAGLEDPVSSVAFGRPF